MTLTSSSSSSASSSSPPSSTSRISQSSLTSSGKDHLLKSSLTDEDYLWTVDIFIIWWGWSVVVCIILWGLPVLFHVIVMRIILLSPVFISIWSGLSFHLCFSHFSFGYNSPFTIVRKFATRNNFTITFLKYKIGSYMKHVMNIMIPLSPGISWRFHLFTYCCQFTPSAISSTRVGERESSRRKTKKVINDLARLCASICPHIRWFVCSFHVLTLYMRKLMPINAQCQKAVVEAETKIRVSTPRNLAEVNRQLQQVTPRCSSSSSSFSYSSLSSSSSFSSSSSSSSFVVRWECERGCKYNFG